MEQQNIKVIVRVRPPAKEEQKLCVEVNSDKQISISNSTVPFCFDYVAGTQTKQIEMMELVGKPVTDTCLKGYNGTIFAYGSTGSGKTYTMQGMNTDKNTLGLMPHIFAYLYQTIQNNSNEEYSVKCQCLEIYNQRINDLLSNKTNLKIRQDTKRGFFVENLSQKTCNSAQDCLRFVKQATKYRKTFGTKMNITSSRSHLLFTLIITRRKMINNANNPKKSVKSRTSLLTLVDLAGSERQNKTNTNGDRLREAQHINKSLSTLGRVIRSIIDNEKHKPFRDSELTKLLKNSIGGNSLTYMIANVSPLEFNFEETKSTLVFANSVKQIQNNAQMNEDKHCSLDALKAENSKFAKIVEELNKKYAESQQKNCELNKENNELKTTLQLQTQSLQNKECKINELSTIVHAQKEQIQKLKSVSINVENSNKNENEISECECEPWIVIENDLLSPNSKRKRAHMHSDHSFRKTKKRRMNGNKALSPVTDQIANTNQRYYDYESEIKMDLKLDKLSGLSLFEMKSLIKSDESMLYKILQIDPEILFSIDAPQWALIEQEIENRLLVNPAIVEKQKSEFIDNVWNKLKVENVMKLSEIFTNKYIQKLTCQQIIEIQNECVLQKKQLKELEKERVRKMDKIVEKKRSNAQMYTKDIEDYGILMKIKGKNKQERREIAEKEIAKQEIKKIREEGCSLYG